MENNIKIVRIDDSGITVDVNFEVFDNTKYRGRFGAKERRSLDDLQDYEGAVFVLNEGLTLKDWSDSNHFNLTDEQLLKLESHLRDISTMNNIKDGEKNWKEYLGEISVQGTIEDENGEEHVLFDLSKNVVDYLSIFKNVEARSIKFE